MSSLYWGTLGGFIAASATALGAFASVWRTKSGYNPWRFITLDFALGMMLSAAAFSMIIPASEEAAADGPVAFAASILAVVLGAVFIKVLGRWLGSHAHTKNGRVGTALNSTPELDTTHTRALLFIIAMMLHNLPEGLASGAALSGLDRAQGISLLAAIALQNVPEGLTTALAFRGLGASARFALLGALASAGVELIGGVMGGTLLLVSDRLLPALLAFAGGAMLTVSLDETKERLIEWNNGHAARAVRDLMTGAFAMLLISLVL